jgi:hypothetical protein
MPPTTATAAIAAAKRFEKRQRRVLTRHEWAARKEPVQDFLTLLQELLRCELAMQLQVVYQHLQRRKNSGML